MALRWHAPVIAFYGVLAIAFLAPMASNTILPATPDHLNYIAGIVQGKLAIDEGQFPIRVAPLAHSGWQYPVFQFYAPLTYTVAGLVYGWITPANPFLAYKVMLWAAMVLGGTFIYLTSLFLTRSRGAAILAGVAYMSAPYMLINVNVRGAFTEVVGQGVLPAILYCTLRCYSARGWSPWFFACGLSWGMLALTHNITFVSGSLFVGLFVLLIDVKRWRLSAGLWRTGAAYAAGLLLAIYMLAPMAAADYLSILDSMAMTWSRWMTPLSTLLSPVSLPPEPQPGHAALEGLNPSIGWPALFALGVVAYAWWQRSVLADLAMSTWTSTPGAEPRLRPTRVCGVLLMLFALAFVMTWTPVDFWPYTPKVLRIAQFTYRWLAPETWIAALAIAYAAVVLFPGPGRLGAPHVAVGTLLIVMSHSSFLQPLRSSQVTIAEIVKKADLGYGTIDYLMNQRAVRLSVADGGDLEVPAVDSAQQLIAGQPAALPRARILAAKNDPELVLNGTIASDHPGTPPATIVTVVVDGRPVFAKQADAAGTIEIRVPLKPLLRDAPASPTAQVMFAIDQAQPNGLRPPPIHITRLVVRGLGLEGAISVESMGPFCARLGPTINCHVTVTGQARNVQLPLLFYPNLLDVRINGQPAAYFPLRSEPFLLASVRLEPGVYDVTGRFRGLAWANTISAIAWIVLIAGLIWSLFARSRIRLGWLVVGALAGVAGLVGPRDAAAQTVAVSGGVMVDARRYDSGDAGPKVYDGQPVGGFAGVDVSLTRRFSVDFEASFSGNGTTTITNPVSIAGGIPVDFTSTYNTRLQTYSGLLAVQLTPSARVRVSVRGGVTYVHHRREIIPPRLQPANPENPTQPQTVVIIDNVAAPAVGVDVDIPLSSRFAIVGAVRANWFTLTPELRAYSIRPMGGVRVLF